MLKNALEEVTNIISIDKYDLSYHKTYLLELLNRLEEGKFNLAVLGQFKRGKSTLVNALLGYKILPSSIIPLTAIPTFIYYSNEKKAKVIFNAKKEKFEELKGDINELTEFLKKYVTEEHNPKNKYNVLKVELYLPSEILKDGFIIIDTPGIGSTHKHNTEMTLNFLPQCDGALFVTSVDPPITEVEIDFLKRVSERALKIYFILNKIDYLDEDERKTSIEFLVKVLNEQTNFKINEKDIIPLSAKMALNGKLKNNENLIKESNILNLEALLKDFLIKEKTEILHKAIALKAFDILNNIISELNIIIKSFKMPVDELEEKVKILSTEIENIENEKVYMNDMLKGDKRRIEIYLDEETEKLRQKATDFFIKKIKDFFDEDDLKKVKEKIQNYIEKEIPPYFEREFGKFFENFNKKVSGILEKYEKKANELIEKVRENAMKLMNIEYIPSVSKEGMKLRVKPYWVVNRWETALEELSKTIIDTILPKGILKKKLIKRYEENITLLINSNIENLHWSIFQGIQDTFRQFSFEFDEELKRVINSTKGAVEKAIEIKKNEAEKIQSEVEFLDNLIKNLEKYKEIIGGKYVQVESN